ncbi:MAG: hypothetical protein FJY65_04610 [Calditrichaeota bacterium]|nr:hypothetical protein [Calditrichota bacterium]
MTIKAEKQTIIGPRICIAAKETREQIVVQVVNTFIANEGIRHGKSIIYFYPVETLCNNEIIQIRRPGGLRKWNFDFKVEVIQNSGLKRGSHADLFNDLRVKYSENPELFVKLRDLIKDMHDCVDNNIDNLMKKHNITNDSFTRGGKVEVFLKVVKWMFIMEDIVYGSYEGRTKLFKALMGIGL